MDRMTDTPFICVVGAPRTGTSMTCELVQACGFNFGPVSGQPGSRDGHTEHNLLTWTKFDEPDIQERMLTVIRAGISACKRLWMWPEFIYRMAEVVPDFRLVVTYRDPRTAMLSTLDFARGRDELQDQVSFAKAAENLTVWYRDFCAAQHFIQSPVCPTFELDFARVVNKDRERITELTEFLGGGDVDEVLARVVAPRFVDRHHCTDWELEDLGRWHKP